MFLTPRTRPGNGGGQPGDCSGNPLYSHPPCKRHCCLWRVCRIDTTLYCLHMGVFNICVTALVYQYSVTCYVLCFLWTPGRVAAASAKANGDLNKHCQRNRNSFDYGLSLIFICTVPVKSLDTPTHSRVVLYFYYFLYGRIIVKTSKLGNNTCGIM